MPTKNRLSYFCGSLLGHEICGLCFKDHKERKTIIGRVISLKCHRPFPYLNDGSGIETRFTWNDNVTTALGAQPLSLFTVGWQCFRPPICYERHIRNLCSAILAFSHLNVRPDNSVSSV